MSCRHVRNATVSVRWHNRRMSRVVARVSAQVQAAPERVVEFLRDYRLHVRESPSGLQESDQMSSFVTTWTVDPSPNGSQVTIESSWDGAAGIAGIFEGFFAPKGLRRIYGRVLEQLGDAVRG